MKVAVVITLAILPLTCSTASEWPVDPEAPPGYIAPLPGKMVYVPAGIYPLGDSRGDGESSEHPPTTAFIRAFRIDENLTTNAEYAAYERAHNLVPAPFVTRMASILTKPLQPIAGVTLNEAQAYCKSLSKRLPTEWEWEVAARSGTTSVFPWGNEAPLTGTPRANLGSERPERLEISEYASHDGFTFPSPVGAFPAGKTPWGLYDMAGNMWQLTSTDFVFNALQLFEKSGGPPPDLPPSDYLTMRGGAWNSSSWSARSTARRPFPKTGRGFDVGFRCAQDAE